MSWAVSKIYLPIIIDKTIGSNFLTGDKLLSQSFDIASA